ncbi:3-[(3aS,4S,7aS)-7a-methyl-1,5-dioxo-octahydro-1H-inden-4-yl]propanoyl:CoA ligase-like [Mytilus californianus]|uniref:3-[(3aS,4S,7aS)-7a-methyl-1, 5-dioxo-octahydro-1H-inden-4-yl]propanoyl:CoA ligase-like n=1 Tax=Mytilus californianus TaxID=6549 RepID=UPI002247180F|nr:3-[(3aS,4S,7aS)-7a-methyl-1,5-dioxo-octahydro-1H-inden-4-yl]propanoyl:CoA ligase-like [Mytilus californianus]
MMQKVGTMERSQWTIGGRLRHHASIRSDKPAFIIRSAKGTRDVMSCQEIYEQSVLFAAGLFQKGLRKGDTVGISFFNSREWLIATFGCQVMGAIPFHFKFQSENGKEVLPILHILGNCTAIILGSNDEKINNKFIEGLINSINGKEKTGLSDLKCVICEGLENELVQCINFTSVMKLGSEFDSCLPETNPDEVIIYFTTSGSSGLPKLVPKTHIQLLDHGEGAVFACEMSADDVFFSDRLFDWIGGYPVVFLVSGSTHVTLADLFTIGSFSDIYDFMWLVMESEKCTVSRMLPSFIFALLKRENPTYRLRVIDTSGLPVPANCAEVLGRFCDEFVSHYGSSEMNFVSFKRVKSQSEFSDYCVGKPLPWIEMKVVNQYGETAQKNEDGELFVRNKKSFSGYFGNLQETEKSIDADGWYRTDDVAFINDNGEYVVHGRCSDIILCYGAHIKPANIEAVMMKHPGIAEVCVVRISDPESFQKPCVCVVPKEGITLTVDELEAFALKDVTNLVTVVIKTQMYVIFEKFPKTVSGKPKRKEILATAVQRLKI